MWFFLWSLLSLSVNSYIENNATHLLAMSLSRRFHLVTSASFFFVMETLVPLFWILGTPGFSMDCNLQLDGHLSVFWFQPWLVNFSYRTAVPLTMAWYLYQNICPSLSAIMYLATRWLIRAKCKSKVCSSKSKECTVECVIVTTVRSCNLVVNYCWSYKTGQFSLK